MIIIQSKTISLDKTPPLLHYLLLDNLKINQVIDKIRKIRHKKLTNLSHNTQLAFNLLLLNNQPKYQLEIQLELSIVYINNLTYIGKQRAISNTKHLFNNFLNNASTSQNFSKKIT